MQGTLIVIDGADGAGKATQARMLFGHLLLKGFPTQKLDFPRYTQNPVGQYIRECLDGKHGDFMHTPPKTASMLYALDRLHEKETIMRWLSEGQIVVLDRYISANMLHQGAKLAGDEARKELFAWLKELEYGLLGLPQPDIVFYLNTPLDHRLKMLEKSEQEGKNQSKTDVAEKDIAHQKATTESAALLLATENNWQEIACAPHGTLRAPADIHEEIFQRVLTLLQD